jgi:excisionase family DNA binding protein
MKRTLLSVKEIAQELGVSVQSIRRAYWRGEIPAYRLSTMLRFDLERVPRIFLAKGLSRIVRIFTVLHGGIYEHLDLCTRLVSLHRTRLHC